MPGSTPVYGFPYPEPTDLVADYPALGQQLAEDIEAVLPTLGGMTLISPTGIAFTGTSASSSGGTTTVNACSVIRLDGVFSATYQAYRVLIIVTPTTGGNLTVRLSTGGTPNSGATSYTRQRLTVDSTTVAGQRASDSSWYIVSVGTGMDSLTIADFANPFAAAKTSVIAQSYDPTSGSYMFNSVGNHDQTTSYDGIEFTMRASGTVTGKIRVYGYKGA